METNTIYKGLALDVIKTLPDDSINTVITSPPYWQLRDYGFSEQWGLEPTYQEYLERLWSLMDEIWRVLKSDGSVWINLGDTYGTVSGSMRDGKFGKLNTNNQAFIQPKTINKCLLLIPHRFAIGCIDRGWVMRNDIVWAKRNGMPESVTDRFSKKHEYFFFMTKSTKYYFDLDSIRDKHSERTIDRAKYKHYPDLERIDRDDATSPQKLKSFMNDKGKNPGDISDFWDIPTKPNSKEHYAAFNEKLIEKPIIAGCPEGGIILDPFCGTATTLLRAYELDRKVIGIEGSEEYFKAADLELRRKLSQYKMVLK